MHNYTLVKRAVLKKIKKPLPLVNLLLATPTAFFLIAFIKIFLSERKERIRYERVTYELILFFPLTFHCPFPDTFTLYSAILSYASSSLPWESLNKFLQLLWLSNLIITQLPCLTWKALHCLSNSLPTFPTVFQFKAFPANDNNEDDDNVRKYLLNIKLFIRDQRRRHIIDRIKYE